MKAQYTSVLSILLLALLGHVNSFPGAFHYDDAHSIVENASIRSFARIAELFFDPALFSSEKDMAMYRPLVVLSYRVNYALGGLEAAGYIAVNLLLHACTAVVVLLLLQRWLANGINAWAPAAVFALHPVNGQVVNYVSSRSESMAALAVCAALYFVLGNRDRAAWCSYALGLLAKSQAIVLMPLLLVVQWGRRQWPTLVRSALPFAAMSSGYLALIYANDFLPHSLAQDVRAPFVQAYAQIKGLVYYVYLFAWPVPLSIEHPLEESQRVDGAVLCAGAALSSAVYLVLRTRHWLGRGVLFWLAAMSLTSVVPLNVVVNEHRLYLGSVGLCALLAGLPMGPGRRMVRRLGVVYLLFLAALGWQRNAVWQDEYSLWSDAVDKAPNSFRALSNLGLAQLERGDLEAARQTLERALDLNPEYGRTWSNMGLVYEELGAYDRAESAYRKAVALRPDWTGFRLQLGRLYLGLGRYGEAIALLADAAVGDVHSGAVHALLGLAHQRAGRIQLAVEQYDKAITLGNLSIELFNNLGLARQDIGDWDGARRAFSQALERAPEDGPTHINLRMLALRRSGRSLLECYEQLVVEFPRQADLWRALASELAGVGRLGEAIDACQKVLEIHPQDRRARDNIMRLRALDSTPSD